MCVVSNIHDHYEPRWPELFPPSQVYTWPTTTVQWTVQREKDALDLFEEIIGLTKKLDAILGLPDCESAHKTEWMNAVRERIRKHEAEKVERRLGGDDGPREAA